MRQTFAIGFLGFLIAGCAELLPSTDPGTPGGGKYCNRARLEDEPQCYPTEDDRAAAYHHTQEVARPAGEVAAQRAAVADAIERQQKLEQARALEAQRQDEEKRARAAKQEQAKQDRDQKEEDRKERSDQVARMATDKTYAVPAISAIICSIESEMADDRALLDRERRVAAIGGTMDLRERHQLSSEIVDDTDELKVWRTALRRYGGPQVPCKELSGVIKCRENALRDCDAASVDVAAVWYEQFETLWGLPDQSHRGR